MLGIENIYAYVIPTNILYKFLLGPNNSYTFTYYDSISSKELEKIYLQRIDNEIDNNNYSNTYFILIIFIINLLFVLKKYFLL